MHMRRVCLDRLKPFAAAGTIGEIALGHPVVQTYLIQKMDSTASKACM